MATIKLELEVGSAIMNEDAMDHLRIEIRQRMLAFLFECVDHVATKQDMRFSHRDIGVTGEITLV